MKLSHTDLKIHNQKAHSLLDRRYAERVPIRYRITYSGEGGARIVTGEGALKDLSKTGCKILGAATSSLGSRLTLLLDLEDGQAPMAPHRRPRLLDRQRLVCRQIPQTVSRRTETTARSDIESSQAIVSRRSTGGIPDYLDLDFLSRRKRCTPPLPSLLKLNSPGNPIVGMATVPRHSSHCSIPAWTPARC